MTLHSVRRSAPSRRPAGRRIRNRNLLAAVLFMAPALVALIVLRLLPAAAAMFESLQRSTLLGGTSFVGFDNYVAMFQSSGFLNSLGVTLLFALIVNPVQVASALLLAVLYSRASAGSKFWRTLVVVPIAAPPAVAAVIWSVIYRPDGIGNSLLRLVGIPEQPFLTSSDQALFSLIVLLSWVGVGYWMMFLIAGINDIPQDYYEAAALDGSGFWRTFFSITLPLLRRPLAFVLVADTVSNFLVFAPVQILTRGGPDGSTNLLMYDIFTRAYTTNDINTAQAEVVILVLITVVVVAIQFRLLREDS
ncbi:carbohydrate ABC transporter permease [Salinibacterium sp. SWN1162]|uniref:carbohydrate ABC transporter permease n=1 Tax=Salinibacterium sp. SWN1162 TaxID=2792053 RepID=UPI0018CE22F8|nr:sugar ABC transporter permease [Salinibacterium sp. SWN1162]MBH0009952.1 sugar ABC transporter permease [Salinibacterium sp. SWN1162]